MKRIMESPKKLNSIWSQRGATKTFLSIGLTSFKLYFGRFAHFCTCVKMYLVFVLNRYDKTSSRKVIVIKEEFFTFR